MLKFLLSLLLFVSTGLCEQKLVCYWNHGNTPAENIDTHSCTHIHYSFVTLDSTTLLIREPGGDLKDVLALKSKNPNLKIVAALGGGGDGGDGKYGRLVLSAQSRANFAKHTVQYLNQHNLDGLDFDWEYPACPQTDCDEKHRPEKPGFASLLRELRTAFNGNTRKLSLSVAVNAGKWLTDNAYEYPTMASAVDYINVMTYDDAGSWTHKTGHHSPFEWCKKSMQFWASNGVPKSKLLMGIPFYGVTFSLKNATQHGLGAPVDGSSGAITYHQICSDVKREGWKKERSSDGPIAYHGSQWVGYDDPISAAQKAKWVKDNGFGGILVWELSQDDLKGDCCKTPKPMISAVGYGLFGKGSAPETYGCE